jgi:GDPmannose 4,6-dehydratase
MPTALISGVTGQDGSFLAEQLLAKGFRVVGLYRRLSAENHWRIAHLEGRLELHCADLLDLGSLMNVMEETRPDWIFNLAAQSFVPTSWQQPLLTGEVTALGAARMLEAFRRCAPMARFYQASSSEMFGNARESPQDERTPFSPLSPYAVSKVYAHQLAGTYRSAYGLFVVCGILFNHESERRGMEFLTRKVSHGVARIKLGLQEGLRLGDLAPRRDWGFAGDYTRAMQAMLALDAPQDLVIASGQDRSVEDFVSAAFAQVDLDWRDHVQEDQSLYRKNELPCLRGDSTVARSLLNWAPKVGFQALVKRMVEADLKRLA